MPRPTAVFIDGGYWAAMLRDEFSSTVTDPATGEPRVVPAKVDFGKLVESMASGYELLRAYYYYCMPYQSNPPTQEER